MEEVYQITRRVAKSNASVLLLGETGTGKELIAGAIHKLSGRSSGPFVKVNCGALSEVCWRANFLAMFAAHLLALLPTEQGDLRRPTATIFLDEINSTSLFCK